MKLLSSCWCCLHILHYILVITYTFYLSQAIWILKIATSDYNLHEQLSQIRRAIVQGWGDYPGGNCPGSIIVGSNYPGGNCPGRNNPGGNCPAPILFILAILYLAIMMVLVKICWVFFKIPLSSKSYLSGAHVIPTVIKPN